MKRPTAQKQELGLQYAPPRHPCRSCGEWKWIRQRVRGAVFICQICNPYRSGGIIRSRSGYQRATRYDSPGGDQRPDV